MGESKLVTKEEIHDLARKVGEVLSEVDMRIHSLALSFDCLVTVLGKANEVKAELERRKALAEAAKKAAEAKPVETPAP